MNATKIFSIITLLGGILCGCTPEQKAPCSINPLYHTLAEYNSLNAAQRDSVWRSDSATIALMFDVISAGSGRQIKADTTTLMRWAQSDVNRIFMPAVDSVFPTLAGIEEDLSVILARGEENGMKIGVKEYVAVVWGNRRSMVFADSVMFIALNHYLGADYPGYASWPKYMAADKTPERLPYDMAEALVAHAYPYEPAKDATLVNRLVYEGVLTMAKIRLVPQGSMAEALGYDEEQLQWLDTHQQEVWNALVGKRLLYDTSELTADRLVSPSPGTTILHPDAPGRAGRYIGYRIIVDYMENNSKVTLGEMLSPDFYNDPQVLMQSSYSAQ